MPFYQFLHGQSRYEVARHPLYSQFDNSINIDQMSSLPIDIVNRHENLFPQCFISSTPIAIDFIVRFR